MAIQKITGDVIATSAVTADSLADTTITAAKLHTTLDLTGKTVTVSTASAGDNDTTVASTAFVSTAVSNLVDSSPDALNTLNELAAALGDDANFSTTVTNSIATKLPLAGGTMTGNIAHASDFTLDVGGDINLDADGADINLKDGGTAMGRLGLENGDLNIASSQQDYDIRLKGNDGGSVITALHLDMSNAGAATFNSSISSGVINAFGASGGSNLSYASNFKADSANIQITLERGTDATGWGGLGASGSNALMVYNESTQQKLTLTQAGSLGIGEDSPDQKLVVNAGNIKLKSNADGNTGVMMFYDAAGNASGQVYPSAGDLRIWSPNDVLILPTGNIGIGTASPQAHLHVFKGESGAPTPLTDSTLILENSTHNYLQFLGPNTTQQGIVFGDADDDNVASVAYNHNTDDLDITALDNVNIVADILNYSNLAGTGYFHMTGSGSRYADSGFWAADNYQLEVGNAHMYLKTHTSAKDIILGTHNTERMRISGSGHHIGMGTGNHFVIAEDGAGTYLGKDNNSSLRFITANASRMTINNTGTTILTSGATNLGVLQLSSSVATYQLKGGDNIGYMGYYTGGYHRWFGSDGVEDMKLTSAGLVVTNANTYQGIHTKGSNAPCFTLGKGTSSTPEWRMGITGYDGDDFAISTGTSTNDRFRMDPSGNTMIGSANNVTPIAMHNTVATFSARGPIASGYSMGGATGGPRNVRDWFVYSSSANIGSNLYIHMKTNLWGGGSPSGNIDYTMSSFRYHSYYAYGGQTTPGGYIGWHNWSGSFFNGHLVNEGTLALVQSSYTSSDGYVVLVAKVGTSYAQFSIDWAQWAGYPFRERKVTAVTNTASATGAY